MTDSCVIERSPLGTQEWILDETTGSLSEPTDPTVGIYDGICQVVASAEGAALPAEIGLATRLNLYTVRIPWDLGDDIEKGDYLNVSVCNDTTIEGRPMQVLHVVRTSLLVWRELVCELLESNRGG